MAGGGQYFIMFFNIHGGDHCTHRLPELFYRLDMFCSAVGMGCQDNSMVFKQVSFGGGHTAFFRSGNRVARHQLGWQFTVDRFCRLYYAALNTGHIGNGNFRR